MTKRAEQNEETRRRPGGEKEETGRRKGGDQEEIRRRSRGDQEETGRRSGEDQEEIRRRPGGEKEETGRRSGEDLEETGRRKGGDREEIRRRSRGDQEETGRRKGEDQEEIRRNLWGRIREVSKCLNGRASCQLQVPPFPHSRSESRGVIFSCGAGLTPRGSGMSTKIIYFKLNGKLQRAEFRSNCSSSEVKDLFRAAAEAEPHHILKMYNMSGTVMNISPQLEANSADSYYRLEVVASDLDFLTAFHMELEVLQNFLFEVYCHYNNIPFHNFQHCFCVTQMMYGLIWLTDLRNKLSRIDLLIMLTSALCHDLDHPGYNNVYQINAQTDLALRYNDISPLENHHCAVAFGILAKPECNILKNLSNDVYKHIRGGMIKCILATDMSRHNEILNKFKAMQPVFNFTNKEHKEVLMKIMVKVSDISNEARPMEVAEPWLDCLLQEFFNQSDTEKQKGLPVAPFMDRDKVSKPSSQTSFIRFVLLPLFTELTKLFPCLEQHILEPVRRALDYYSDLEKASKEDGGAKP